MSFYSTLQPLFNQDEVTTQILNKLKPNSNDLQPLELVIQSSEYTRQINFDTVSIVKKLPQMEFPNTIQFSGATESCYLEILIMRCLPVSQIQIGLCSLKQVQNEPLPFSLSYSQDGQIDKKKFRNFSQGDTVGVYKDETTAFFTLNGSKIGENLKLDKKEKLQPAVCLTCQGDTIRFRTAGGFLFDLQAHRKKQILEQVQKVKEFNFVDMKPFVMQYLSQMGYSETYAALATDDNKPIVRKNTFDDQIEQYIMSQDFQFVSADSDTRDIISDQNSLKKNEDLPFLNSLISDAHKESSDLKFESRQRFHSTLQQSKPFQIHTSRQDQNLQKRGHLRMLLRENAFESARSFANSFQENYDKSSIFALEFIHRFKTGESCLQMIQDPNTTSLQGMIPSPNGDKELSVCLGLLCYQNVDEVTGTELGYLISEDQRSLLIDRVCQRESKISKLELLVKTLLALEQIEEL